MVYRIIVLALMIGAAGTQSAFSCTRTTPVSARDMVAGADVIVRATAVEYTTPPQVAFRHSNPESRIRFLVREAVKGTDVPGEIVLPGYLSDKDDYNDHPAPYEFVRRNGRFGDCFANTYRSGADFLLVLKQHNGVLTVNWYALGPVNEQLRMPNDPWLAWVREQVRGATTEGPANRRLQPTAVGCCSIMRGINRRG